VNGPYAQADRRQAQPRRGRDLQQQGGRGVHRPHQRPDLRRRRRGAAQVPARRDQALVGGRHAGGDSEAV